MHTHTRISRGFVRDVHFPVCRLYWIGELSSKVGAAPASAAMSAASVER